MEFFLLNSAEHTDCNVDANQAMSELHTSWLRFVLQVPHTIALSEDRLVSACSLNDCELCSRSEKGRHELIAGDVVMFKKKF